MGIQAKIMNACQALHSNAELCIAKHTSTKRHSVDRLNLEREIERTPYLLIENG